MISALALLATLALQGGLDEARAAFSRGDYAAAEAQAAAAAAPPHAGAALYLVGLSRFRSGRPEEALDALARAEAEPDAPPAAELRYNRASCLYELGRFAEAEPLFAAAAEEGGPLAAAALLNAGFAALDAGAPARAQRYLDQARPLASGAAVGLLADLEVLLAPAPRSQEGPRDREAAEPEGPPQGVRAGTTGLAAQVELGGGYDSSPLQAGTAAPAERPQAASSAGSAFVSAGGLLSWGFLGLGGSGQLGVRLGQLAYLDPAASDYSLQQHTLWFAFERRVGRLLLGGQISGEGDLIGLGALRGLQLAGGAGLHATCAPGERGSVRLDLAWSHAAGLSDFAYLTGDRLDAALSGALTAGPLLLRAGYRLRAELIGAASSLVGGGSAPQAQLVEPFGYLGHLVWLGLGGRLGERLSWELGGALELRAYRDDTTVTLVGIAGPVVAASQRRFDWRWSGSAAATVQLAGPLALVLRYDLLIDRSNQDGTGRPSLPDRRYDKQVVSAVAALSW